MLEKRTGKDDYYLGIADAVLARSTCLRRKYGAIIVKADEIFTVLMGEKVEPRKEFIEQNAKHAVNVDI